MALPSITLRSTKGSALTYAEADANFTNLSTATTKVLVGSTTTSLALNDTLTLAAGSNVTLSADSSTKTVTIAATSSGLSDVNHDPAPTLGGDLDTNNYKIKTVGGTNYNITLEPDGTGKVIMNTNEVRVGDVDVQAHITNQGAGGLKLSSNYGNDGAYVEITTGTTAAINLEVPAGGTIYAKGYFVVGDGGYSAVRSPTDVALSLQPGGVTQPSITLQTGTNAGIVLAPTGSGQVQIDNNYWPATDGTAGQTLMTNGSGQLTWVNSGTTLTTATATVLGGIKIGANLAAIGDGTLRATPSGSNTQLQFNDSGAFGGSASLFWDGSTLTTPNLVLSNSNVNEGGEMRFALPSSGSTLTTSVTMDIYQNKLRIFETGGTNRGGYFDISALGASVGTNLAAGGGGSAGVSSITFGSTGLTPSSATTGTVTVGGVLNVANGGLGTSEVAGVGRIPIGNGSNYVPAFLTAGSGIAITTGSGTVSIAATGGASAETVYAYTFSATFAPNWTNGTIQTTTITANITSLAFTSPATGQTITIVATQDATGNRTLPASSSTLKYANGVRTLSGPNGVDLITISYIGTVYYVSITRGYA